jgi:glycosyltransferase involved in cell wall biosynthesis
VIAGLAAADAVVAPSDFMAGEIQREYGVDSDKVRVIHNFSTRNTSSARNKEPFFFGAGRVWDPAKNFALLEQIAPYLKWPVKLAGKDNGERQSPLQKLGQVQNAELLDLLARATVFVHPALYEPFGLSVLDAARSRCGLVLADIPSLRELWGDAAVFVDPRNPSAWIEQLNLLSDDSARLKNLGDRAFAHAQSYTAEASVRDYRRLYADLIGGQERRAEEAA